MQQALLTLSRMRCIVGESACCLANRNGLQVGGTPVGVNYAGGGYVLVVSPDFRTRQLWTVFSQGGGGALLYGVAARGGVVAVAGAVTTDDMVQARALQPGAAALLPKDAPDGYFCQARLTIEGSLMSAVSTRLV